MKKTMCLLIALVMLTGMLPLNALAVEDTFSMTEAEVLAISRLCGYENANYRKGMSFSSSMSAWQMYSWLTEFKEEEAAGITSRYAALDRLLDEMPALRKRPEMDGFDELNAEIDRLNSEVSYFIFQFEEQINAVSGAVSALKGADDGGKASLYRRLQKADIRMRAIMSELAGIQNGDKAFTLRAASLSERLDAYSAAREKLARSLVSAAKPTLLQAGDFHFTVIDLTQIGFVIYDENRQPLPGATVRVVSGGKTQTLTANQYGTAVFPSGYFELDERNRLTAEVYVTADGKRDYESHALHLTGGEGSSIYLQADNGEPYIQYMDFRGIDILHESETVYTTAANDADQAFAVGIHTAPGKQGTLNLLYTEADTRITRSVNKTITGTADKVVSVDLTDKWCSMLEPGMAVTASLTGTGGGTSETHTGGIVAEKAAVNVPLPNIPLNSATLPGTQVMLNLPINLPLLKNIQVGFNFPAEISDAWPVSCIITPEGYFSLGISVTKSKEYSDKASESSWKTKNSLETREAMEKLIETRETLASLAEKGIQKRKDANSKLLDLCKTRFDITVAAMLTGKVNPEKTGLMYDGALDLLVTVAGTGAVSLSEPFMVGPVPFYFGFDLTVGVMAGVNIGFSFKTSNLSAIRFQDWTDFKFDKDKLDIIISPRASFAFYGGVGVKGVMGLCIRAYSNFVLTLHIRPAATKYKFILQASVNLGVEAVVELLFVRFKATLVDFTWTGSDPDVVAGGALRATSGTGGGKTAQESPESFVRAQIKHLPANFSIPAGMEVFNLMDQTALGIYKTNKKVNNIERPWLGVSMIMYSPELDNNPIFKYNRFIPVNMPDLGKTIWPKGIPNDAYVTDFAAVAFDDVCPDGTTYKAYALVAVFAQHANDDADGNPTRCMGEIHYIFVAPGDDIRVYAGDKLDMTGGVWLTIKGLIHQLYSENESPVSVKTTVLYNKSASTASKQCYTVTASWTKENGIFFHTQDVTVSSGTKFAKASSNDGYDAFYYTNFVNVADVFVYGMNNTEYDITLLRQMNAETMPLTKLSYHHGNDLAEIAPGIDPEDTIIDYEDIVHVESDEHLNTKIVLLQNRDETGKCDVVVRGYTRGYGTAAQTDVPRPQMPVKLDTRLSPAELCVVNLGETRALYYVEQNYVNAEETNSSFGLKAVYLADGSDGMPYISRPFYLAKFDISDVPANATFISCRLFKNPNAFISGIAEISMPTDNGEPTPAAYMISFQETLQVDIRSSAIENPLLKAGEIGNLLFNVKNTGNVPVSRFGLDAYAVDENGERRNLSKIVVACADPVYSSVSAISAEGFISSIGKSSAAVSEFDYALDEGYRTLTTSVGDIVTNYSTNVLMPGETRCYRATFRVPDDFDPGEYETYLTPNSISTISTRGKDGRLDSTSAWVSTMLDTDSDAGKEAMKPAGVNDTPSALRLEGGLFTVTAEVIEAEPGLLRNGNTPENDSVPVRLFVEGPVLASGGNGNNMLSAYANRTIANKNELDLAYADISIRARRIDAAGEEQAHIVLQNDAATSVNGLVVKAEVDGVGTFSYPLDPSFRLDGTKACSLDIPLDILTGGRKGEKLTLTVSCGTGDLNAFNNSTELPLMNAFAIIGQPVDQFVIEGSPASFDVLVRGGEMPYSYQWQLSTGRNGGWQNIKGETDRIYYLEKTKLAQNGTYVRCIVKDAAGEVLTSMPALLTVKNRIPPTGDGSAPCLYIAFFAVSVGLAVLLLRNRKRQKDCM